MAASILGIGTAVPPTRLTQDEVRAVLSAPFRDDRRTSRLIDAAFAASAIDTRHTVLAEIGGGTGGLHVRDSDALLAPSTGTRNDAFRAAAPALFAEASRGALTAAGVAAAEVTHVVTVSCTGLMAPGPDYHLVRDLELSPAVERDHLGFIGCAAAVPALRSAARIVAAQPDAVVLVAAAELCSLHIVSSHDPEQIVAAAVFADGAAAAIVSGPRDDRRRLDLDGFATRLAPDGESDMVWTVGDSGFRMTLTPEVPRIVGREIAGVVDDVFGGVGAMDAWAVHPGGRSILDRVDAALGLPPGALGPSREVLRTHGNMSSATLLFILRAMMADEARPEGQRIGALAFGPGLTVESARLTVRGGVLAGLDAAAMLGEPHPALAGR